MAMSSRSAKDRYRPDTVGAREGFTPPACRNHRTPTADDTPISSAASSELAPRAIATQNWSRSCRHATVGRPGDGICPRYNCTARCRSRIVPINTSTTEVLRRPVESAQFRSHAFVRALRAAGLQGSMGRVGACADNAAMESFFSLLLKNVLNRRRWTTPDQLRLVIVIWIERTYHRRRRQDALGRLTPIEFETLLNTTHAT